MMHITYLKIKILIYPAYKVQIILLIVEKITIWAKYLNFSAVFLKKLVAEPFKCAEST